MFVAAHKRLEMFLLNIKASIPINLKQGEDLRRILESTHVASRQINRDTLNCHEQIDKITYEFVKQDRIEKVEAAELKKQLDSNSEFAEQFKANIFTATLFKRKIDELKIVTGLNVY